MGPNKIVNHAKLLCEVCVRINHKKITLSKVQENKHTATIEAKLSSAKTISEALWNSETVREK